MSLQPEESTGKKQRTEGAESSFFSQFHQIGRVLDATNEKRERLVKASRDVTIHSKKVIFAVHRATGPNKVELLEQAEKDLAVVRTSQVSRLARELQGNDYWKFRRAYSPGIQEYVEAATVVEYCKTGSLLTLQQLNQSFADMRDADNMPFTVSIPDYILGVADLTGELMRLAVSGIAAGQRQAAISVCNIMGGLYQGFCLLPPLQENIRDSRLKMDTMLQSLIKVETACYTVHVRGSEYPQEMLLNAFDLPTGDHGDEH
ncbi:unnamed protein product [Calypogeia fissa]